MEINEMGDDELLNALNIKLTHYKQGYVLIKDIIDKASHLREEIEIIESELGRRFEQQQKEAEK